MRRTRRALIVALLVILVVAAWARERPGGSLASAEPPTAGLLIVQANLQDAVRPADAADTRDLDNFVRRLRHSVPRPPDALLLTEILGPGAHRVARTLSRETGRRYVVALAPGRSAFLPSGAVRESAILVDAAALRLSGDARFRRVQDEDQAHALVAQRRGGLELSLISAHAAGDPRPAASALREIAAEAPEAMPVIGADFRLGRCAVPTDDQPIDCAAQPFWTDLTLTHAYSDAFFESATAQARKLSNYLFVRGSVEHAAVDAGYDPGACKAAFDAGQSHAAPPPCRSTYYADAPLGWAVVGRGEVVQRSIVPASVALDHCELGTRKAAVLARLVNNSDEHVSDSVSAEAADPLTVEPSQAALEVPAGEARNLPLRITAPQAGTGTGTYRVTVRVGPLIREVPVQVPDDCIEPRVYATSYHAGFEPENAIDGDINTFWHSEYSPPTPLPQSITLNLGQPTEVSQVEYQPRFDGNLNGTITAYNVYVSGDGQSFTQVASGTWAPDARLKVASFAPVPARYVRLEATAGHNGSYASAAEVRAR